MPLAARGVAAHRGRVVERPPGENTRFVPPEAAVVDLEGIDEMLAALADLGYETTGPTVRAGAVVPGRVASTEDLPVGWHDEQSPGRYRLERGDDEALFAWAVGPGSQKRDLFPPVRELWQARRAEDGRVTFVAGQRSSSSTSSTSSKKQAYFGARPCELAALAVLDAVLMDCATPDPVYEETRRSTVVIAAECGTPASTCFCTSMGKGPEAVHGFDLALTELVDGSHRFLVRVGSEKGAELLSRVASRPATEGDLGAREAVTGRARAAMADRPERERLDTDGLADILAASVEHPRWQEVAERCLSCGNCTLVCPTCFCSDVRDTTDLSGTVHRTRSWASCFDLEHSYIHGGAVRVSVASRYRQWLTHKLSTWWDQFGTSGCVGCGRCIAWCPVGIDLRVEAAAIRATARRPDRADPPEDVEAGRAAEEKEASR